MTGIELFNRIVVILVLLALIAGLLIFIVIAAFPDPMVGVLQNWLGVLGRMTPLGKVIVTVLSLLAIVICFFLLWLEIRRSSLQTVKISQVIGGEAEMTTDSVAQRIAYNVDQLADVVKVSPRVMSKGRAVEVLLDVETSPDVDVPAKTDEVLQVARQVIEERMGLELHKIRVNIRHVPYPKRSSG